MSKREKAINSEPIKAGKSPWFSTSELLEYLGISQDELNQHFSTLTKGTHYKIEKSKDNYSQILWRVDLIDQLLSPPVAPLEREAMLNAINNHITCER